MPCLHTAMCVCLHMKEQGSVPNENTDLPSFNIPGNKEPFRDAQTTFSRRTHVCEYPAQGTGHHTSLSTKTR